MIAGDLSIRISAELAQFERDMTTTVARAGRAGNDAGARYASEFAKFGESMKQRLQNSLAGVTKNLLNPMSISMAFVDGLTNAIRTGNVAQAYVDMVESLPIVGTFANLLTAIYDRATGQIVDGDALAPSAELDDIRRRGAERRRREAQDEAARIVAIEAQKAKEVEDLRKSMADTTADLNSVLARKRGDEEKAIAFEIDRQVARLSEQRQAALNGATDEQKSQIHATFDLRRKLILEEGYERLRRIDEEKKRKIEADREMTEKAEIDAIESARIQFEKRREDLERLADMERELEEERIAAQTAGISEGQTALGTFRFDAYPATQKKANDERIVKALEDIRSQGLTSAVGGFS